VFVDVSFLLVFCQIQVAERHPPTPYSDAKHLSFFALLVTYSIIIMQYCVLSVSPSRFTIILVSLSKTGIRIDLRQLLTEEEVKIRNFHGHDVNNFFVNATQPE